MKKFAIYFSKILKDLSTENRGKLPRKILRQQTNRHFSILIRARPVKILKLKHYVAVFSKTFYLLQPFCSTFWSKNKVGQGPPGPSPGSATAFYYRDGTYLDNFLQRDVAFSTLIPFYYRNGTMPWYHFSSITQANNNKS